MSANIQRKCPNCGTWNTNTDFCASCSQPISLKIIKKQADKEKERVEKNKPKDGIDIAIEKLKHHPFFLVRWIFAVFQSIFLVFMAIASFVAYIIAWAAT